MNFCSSPSLPPPEPPHALLLLAAAARARADADARAGADADDADARAAARTSAPRRRLSRSRRRRRRRHRCCCNGFCSSPPKVVDQIDTLTSDLQLEDEMTDSSKTDTLNSSSSGTTASSIEKIKVQANAPLIKPPAHPSAILTVLRKPNPPPPPPRLTPVRCEEPQRVVPTVNPVKTNGTLLRNGGLPGGPNKIPNGDICCISTSNLDKPPLQPLIHRPEKERCPQAGPRERVRFSEKVQYHGYCPDCDTRYNMKSREVHLHSEPVHPPGKIPQQGPPLPPPPHLPPFPLENGGLGISHSNSFAPPRPATVPPPTAPKPQKTILRKSTTTTV